MKSGARGKARRWVRRTLLALGALFVAALIFIGVSAPLNPVRSVVRTVGFALGGRLHYPQSRLGQVVTDEDGNRFTIFREVIVDPTPQQPRIPGAVLTLHFRVTNLSPEMNKFYSGLPLPLYMGDPGFRSKLFTINGSECQSIYEWDTVKDAQNYLKSVALKTILRRAVPGSVRSKITSR